MVHEAEISKNVVPSLPFCLNLSIFRKCCTFYIVFFLKLRFYLHELGTDTSFNWCILGLWVGKIFRLLSMIARGVNAAASKNKQELCLKHSPEPDTINFLISGLGRPSGHILNIKVQIVICT